MDTIDIAFLVYPGVALLDLAGPYDVLHPVPGARLTLVAKTREPVVSDTGMTLLPAATFDSVPRADVLCVPGGAGQIAQMDDARTVEWLRAVGGGASWVTSVCTGALLLGAADLLR